jgi:regulatory protein
MIRLPPRRLDPNYKPPMLTLAQAKDKVTEMFGSRDHTLKEIEKKLKKRLEPEIMRELLQWVSEQKWFPTEEAMQEQFVRSLGRRKKGQNYINQKLKAAGLKAVKISSDIELEKALELLKVKWDDTDFKGLGFKELQKQKAKVIRFLAGRGFDLSTASQAYKNYFKTGRVSADAEEA